MKFLKTLLGLVAAATIGMAMTTSLTACSSSDTEGKVNSANSDLDRMKAIELEIAEKGYSIEIPNLSRDVIRTADPGQLDQVEALLNEFLSRAQNVVDVANRGDVKFEGDRDRLSHRIEGAKELKRMLRDATLRPDDHPIHDENVVPHSPKHRHHKR